MLKAFPKDLGFALLALVFSLFGIVDSNALFHALFNPATWGLLALFLILQIFQSLDVMKKRNLSKWFFSAFLYLFGGYLFFFAVYTYVIQKMN